MRQCPDVRAGRETPKPCSSLFPVERSGTVAAVAHFADDQETEDLARAVARRLLDAADGAVGASVRVLEENRDVFLIAYGWFKTVCRTARLVLKATLPPDGYTIEVAPLVRNVFNFAFALHWLVDNGVPAAAAVEAKAGKERRKAIERMVETGWPNAAEALERLNEYEAELPEPSRTEEEAKKHKDLMEELRNVLAMFKEYGSEDLYPVYSHLSGLSHPSLEVSYEYLEPQPGGNWSIRSAPVGIGHAYLIQMAISLLQAAAVVSPLIDGDPMRAAIDRAVADLALEGESLLPLRRSPDR